MDSWNESLETQRACYLSTGKRTDQLVGEGQVVDIPQRWSVSELAALKEFERTMQDEVIREVERVLRMRARLAQESRKWIMF